jgi:hypothetical protein
MATVEIEGITDPDMDPLTLTVTSVKQDEATDALGSGDKGPFDAIIHPDGSVDLRAERMGPTPKNGRVYEISVTAMDDDNLTCERKVRVCVPHDQRNPHECVDDGQNFTSTAP